MSKDSKDSRFKATRLWNELPRTLKEVNSLMNFKAALESRA